MDFKFALRSLRRSPGFTLLAVLVMALGIGANTAVFSVVNAVLLRPLGYRDAERIVVLTSTWKKAAHSSSILKQVSGPDVEDWHDQSTAFAAMAYFETLQASVLAGQAAQYAQITRVTGEFFQVFGTAPAVGRAFSADGAVLISHAYWRSQFGEGPGAIGQTVRMFEKTFTIAGVMPAGFTYPGHTDVWLPIEGPAQYRSGLNYECVARLKPGVSVEQAQAQMTPIATRLEQQYPNTNEGRGVAVTRLQDELTGNIRVTLYLLLGAVGVVLLIACANVATLLLAKATGRAREIAIRAAVGATRGRILRQLIAESLVLSGIAGAVGLGLAMWGSQALVALAPAGVPRLDETGTDVGVLAFNLAMAVAASLLFGLVPALHASRVDLNQALRRGRAGAVGNLRSTRSVLVIAEIAMSVVLLAAAGLLIKSFEALRRVKLGFKPENVLVMKTTVPASGEAAARRANRFFKGLLADAATLPGVTASGATMSPPGHIETLVAYWIDQLPKQLDMHGTPVVASIVAPGTFAALGIPLKRGRDFNDADVAGAPFTAVVNEAVVRKSFPGQDPIGRTIFCPSDSLEGMKIVGVVGDVRQDGPAHAPLPECFMPYQQHRYNGTTLSVVLRTAGDPRALMDPLRKMVRERSPEVSVDFTTMEASLAGNIAPDWFRTLLLGIFAGLAVCLAMAGVYGVMAYLAGQRTSEIGLRMALGATRGDVLRLMLRQGMTLAAIGLVLGLAGAIAASRLLTSLLFEVKPGDPETYAAVAAVVAAVSLAASFLPARSAANVDPLVALRQD
jgi:putative ABC transport system permease protein